MGTIDSILVNMELHVKNANICKDMVVERLLKDGMITQEIANDYFEKYQIIIIKNSWFKTWMDKFLKDSNKDTYSFKLVKFED